jgi:hypothetical protein
MTEKPGKRKLRTTVGLLAVVAIVVGFFTLTCSGLLFPVVGKQSSLTWGIAHDLGVARPTSLTVGHAARLATRDPAYFYECTIDPADIPPFVGALTAEARRRGYDMEDSERDKRFSMEPHRQPAWYNPDTAADLQRLKIFIRRPDHIDHGYWFFFSPAAHKLWVYWFST